ncbi:MAG: TetR/AcrR family transcriptional regulator [Chitinophagaceae bacterium]|nr:TetR/AcrR family transcriptional regulator [Chitinophagaceae bacterium]
MSTKSRKQLEKENRRELILQAAETIMASNGLHGLSIDLIAAETQLAKGTIYLYFKSKEEILSLLSVKARTLLFKEFQKIERRNISNIEKLIAVSKTSYLFYKKNPLYYDLVSLYEVNNQLTETGEMYQSSENITKLVSGIADRARKDGTLRPDVDPLHITMLLWGMTIGVLQLIKVKGSLIKQKMNISEKELFDSFLDTVRNSIKK